MKRVLFLDFDGVLNSFQSIGEKRIQRLNSMIDPYHVTKLQQIIDATGAEVVISSTWRRFHDLRQLRGILYRAGLTNAAVVGRTPDHSATRSATSPYRSVERHFEIRAWLEGRSVDSFVILDDDTDAEIDGRFVRTDYMLGLQDEHVERAIKILMSETATPTAEGNPLPASDHLKGDGL